MTWGVSFWANRFSQSSLPSFPDVRNLANSGSTGDCEDDCDRDFLFVSRVSL